MDKISDDCEEAERSNSNASPPQQSWRGCSISEIHRNLSEFAIEHVAPVRPSADHAVLHHVPIRESDSEPPRPLKTHHKWDAFNVRLPCSPKSQYPVETEDGTSRIESRWEMIQQALLRPIKNSHELQAAILSYNTKYENQWNFRALHCLLEYELDDSEACVFFEDLLPRIIRLALRLPELIQAPIPLLKQGQNQSITLTQQQIACLLANAFLCTFPRRNTMKKKSEYSNFPDINFNRLFQSTGDAVMEKIKCICHYFRRVCPTDRDSSNVPTGVVTFTRRSIPQNELPCWKDSNVPISAAALHISSDGTIEDQGLGLLQVDFANKFLGGGVLGSGCVQEEIRFVICPELLVSKLFTECLRPTEALLMVGCERFSNYTGYARTFKWDGDHNDSTPRDSSRRRLTHIVAIDALRFVQPTHQYREDLMLRELNKAYTGFLHTLSTPAPGVASGNWGCGAFGGEARLKALLQIMVCAQAKRPLVYFTFGDTELRDEVYMMYNYLVEKNVRIQDLWNALIQFQATNSGPKHLYKFIRDQLEHSRNPNKSVCSNIRSFFAPVASGRNISQTVAETRWLEKQKPLSSVAKRPKETETNLSEDIFAVSSDSEMEIIKIDDSSSGKNTESEPSEQIQETLDDSDADDIIAAIDETIINRESKVDTELGTTKKKTVLKQCSLLDMLDKAYMEGARPASKRHRGDTNGK